MAPEKLAIAYYTTPRLKYCGIAYYTTPLKSDFEQPWATIRYVQKAMLYTNRKPLLRRVQNCIQILKSEQRWHPGASLKKVCTVGQLTIRHLGLSTAVQLTIRHYVILKSTADRVLWLASLERAQKDTSAIKFSVWLVVGNRKYGLSKLKKSNF